jgi:hypothetical protein
MKGLEGGRDVDARGRQAGPLGRRVDPRHAGDRAALGAHLRVRLDREDRGAALGEQPRRDPRPGAQVGDGQPRRIPRAREYEVQRLGRI